ncbi:flagellar protein FliT [Scandinavium manionii]|uniref:flagellar protein FliT n=1 Tax=Scandinavium manionii TaxID=2926520 RepID=UPI0013577B14|nr:flagellar protein FliT [Scandinavium manionii]MCS2150668.1 flagellar protein FliT [Scandinavium manionii]MCS2166894.1 flagellar protein FliT [Scandinavium manionii]
MSSEQLQKQLLALIDEMNVALDQQRWRRMPGLRQQVMTVFAEYEAQERSELVLQHTKKMLHDAFSSIIERRESRVALLKERMAEHQSNKEGILAYSMVNLFTEQA